LDSNSQRQAGQFGFSSRINFSTTQPTMQSVQRLCKHFLVFVLVNSKQTQHLAVLLTFLRTKFSFLNLCFIFESSKVTPINLQTDEGSEFMSRTFATLMKKYSVNHYQVYSNVKASICERVNRTIKEKLYRRFSLQGNYVWHNIIQPVVDEYNATKHSKTKLAPKDVTKDDERHLLETVYNYPTKIVKKCKFKVGDYVRLSKYRGPFVKGYLARWGTEQFRIVERNKQYPEKYKVEDKKGERILGSFYKEELQRIKHPNCFIVEKVLRRDKRKKKVLVKYLGLDASHNEWISPRDIL